MTTDIEYYEAIDDLVHDAADSFDAEGKGELIEHLQDLAEKLAALHDEELDEYAREFVPPHPAEGQTLNGLVRS